MSFFIIEKVEKYRKCPALARQPVLRPDDEGLEELPLRGGQGLSVDDALHQPRGHLQPAGGVKHLEAGF